MTTAAELRESLLDPLGGLDAAYREKQIHAVPTFPVVKRIEAIVMLARNETVLDVGGSGPLHAAIAKVATDLYTWDRGTVAGPGESIDLDDVALELPRYDAVTLIVCGEVVEHLSNPGWFLTRLKRTYPGVPVVISVPNAHHAASGSWAAHGVENVNIDHVAWYSYRTLKTLLDRVGYTVSSWSWYNGKPLTAEGLLVVVE